jgi:hypothetical protein
MARSGPPPPANASNDEKLKWFIDGLPEYSTSDFEDHETTNDAEELDVEQLQIKDETPEQKVDGLVRDFLDIGGPEVLLRRSKKEEQPKETKIQNSQDAGTSS